MAFRFYMLTLIPPWFFDEEAVIPDPFYWEVLHPDVRYLVWQVEEAPTTGTLHYQGYVEFFKQTRLAKVKTIFGDTVHVEIRAGTQAQAIAYCTKDDSRFLGFERVSLGEPSKGAGTRSDLTNRDSIYAEAMEQESLELAINVVKEKAPRDWVLYGNGIGRNLATLFDHFKPYEPIFPPQYGPQLPLPGPLQAWLDVEFVKVSRAKCLFLIGPTKLGKSHWARTIVEPHTYFKGSFVSFCFLANVRIGMTNYKECWNPLSKLLIFDDFDWDYLQQPKVVLTQAGEGTLTDKYTRKMKVIVNMPAIFIANDMPHSKGIDIGGDPYWQANGVFVHVDQKLY